MQLTQLLGQSHHANELNGSSTPRDQTATPSFEGVMNAEIDAVAIEPPKVPTPEAEKAAVAEGDSDVPVEEVRKHSEEAPVEHSLPKEVATQILPTNGSKQPSDQSNTKAEGVAGQHVSQSVQPGADGTPPPRNVTKASPITAMVQGLSRAADAPQPQANSIPHAEASQPLPRTQTTTLTSVAAPTQKAGSSTQEIGTKLTDAGIAQSTNPENTGAQKAALSQSIHDKTTADVFKHTAAPTTAGHQQPSAKLITDQHPATAGNQKPSIMPGNQQIPAAPSQQLPPAPVSIQQTLATAGRHQTQAITGNQQHPTTLGNQPLSKTEARQAERAATPAASAPTMEPPSATTTMVVKVDGGHGVTGRNSIVGQVGTAARNTTFLGDQPPTINATGTADKIEKHVTAPQIVPVSTTAKKVIPVPAAAIGQPTGTIDPTVISEEFVWDIRPAHTHQATSSSAFIQRAELPQNIPPAIAEAFKRAPDKPIEIALNPIELGRVRMVMSTNETGIVVTVSAERGDTLDLMRRNIDDLGKSLSDLGFEDVSFAFEQGHEQADQNDLSEVEQANSGMSDAEEVLAAAQTPNRLVSALPLATTGIDMRF